MKLKSLDRNLMITFVSGGITVALLACSFAVLSNLTTRQSINENTVSVELDKNLYGNLAQLFAPTTVVASESSTPFLPVDDQLYVTIDGQQYPVVETENGLEVVTNDNSLGETNVPLSDAIGCDNPNIYVDEYGNKYYHIVWGDTLCKISSELHYSIDQLAEYNGIRNVHLIYAESDLRIPD